MRVRCAGCKTWRPKNNCVPYGLGWCCSVECRWDAIEHSRRRAVVKQRARRREPPKHAPARTGLSNTASQALRARVRERDGNRCRWCQTTANLHVHHVVLRSQGGQHDEHNLLCLCMRCHDIVHSRNRYWQPVLLELLRVHYENRFLTVGQAERALHGDQTLEVTRE